MDKQENRNLLLNRVMAFIAGGLLVFAVMSFTVVSNAKKENQALASTLDLSRFEAGRLLADAKAQYAARDYAKAKESLNTLFVHQPGSTEALAGKKVLSEIEVAEATANRKWDAALAAVQTKWILNRASSLRAQWDKDRSQLEAGLTDKINQEWESEKAKVRMDWEMAG
jgi:hypothetical protein